jgi:hypothetical protein
MEVRSCGVPKGRRCEALTLKEIRAPARRHQRSCIAWKGGRKEAGGHDTGQEREKDANRVFLVLYEP